MTIPKKDKPFMLWADECGYRYYYTDEFGLPEQCLKLHLGVITAYVHEGKLVRLTAHGEGSLLDQMMFEFSQLFALCARQNAYVEQVQCQASRRVGHLTLHRRIG